MTYQKCVKHIAKTSNSKANNGVDNEQKVWHQRPENKARMKAYREEYYQRPENKAKHNAYQKAYYQRPEVKAKCKAYNQRPEVKAYREEYSQKPENKARAKAYWKAYRPRGSLFYKQYGITMTEMGRIMGVSKEAIRKRFVRLNRKMDIN